MRKLFVALLASVFLAVGLVTPASAATSSLEGTVNCTGIETTYPTVRRMQQPSRTELYLTQAAGGTRSGYGMEIGVFIVALAKTHRHPYVGAGWWGTLQSSNNYVKETRFRMTAKMIKSSRGTCSNTWKGNLHY